MPNPDSIPTEVTYLGIISYLYSIDVCKYSCPNLNGSSMYVTESGNAQPLIVFELPI